MASMTYSGALLPLPEVVPAKSLVAERPGFLTRIMNAIMESRYQQAEREVARHRALMAEPVGAVKVTTADLPFDHA